MEESANMTFAGASDEEDEQESDTAVWDWYTDALFEKVLADLMETYGYSGRNRHYADLSGRNYHPLRHGYAHSKIAESIYTDPEYQPSDEEILSGFYMMDYSDGSLATVGSFEERGRQPLVQLCSRRRKAVRLCYQTGFYLCARH